MAKEETSVKRIMGIITPNGVYQVQDTPEELAALVEIIKKSDEMK